MWLRLSCSSARLVKQHPWSNRDVKQHLCAFYRDSTRCQTAPVVVHQFLMRARPWLSAVRSFGLRRRLSQFPPGAFIRVVAFRRDGVQRVEFVDGDLAQSSPQSTGRLSLLERKLSRVVSSSTVCAITASTRQRTTEPVLVLERKIGLALACGHIAVVTHSCLSKAWAGGRGLGERPDHHPIRRACTRSIRTHS